MIGINQLRWMSTHSRVAQLHRQTMTALSAAFDDALTCLEPNAYTGLARNCSRCRNE